MKDLYVNLQFTFLSVHKWFVSNCCISLLDASLGGTFSLEGIWMK